eukprot:358446-Chlamydomonas_euryale.AAC.5
MCSSVPSAPAHLQENRPYPPGQPQRRCMWRCAPLPLRRAAGFAAFHTDAVAAEADASAAAAACVVAAAQAAAADACVVDATAAASVIFGAEHRGARRRQLPLSCC